MLRILQVHSLFSSLVVTYSRFYCWITNHPKLSDMTNSHLILFMHLSITKLGKDSVEMLCVCSMMSGTSDGKTQSLEAIMRGWNHLKAVHSYVWLLILTVWLSAETSAGALYYLKSLQVMGLLYKMVTGLQEQIFSKTQGRNAWHFYNPSSEAIQSCFYWSIGQNSHTHPPGIMVRGYRPNTQ